MREKQWQLVVSCGPTIMIRISEGSNFENGTFLGCDTVRFTRHVTKVLGVV